MRPRYVSSEIVKGEDYGGEVDNWACGVILYILLSGSMPFSLDPKIEDDHGSEAAEDDMCDKIGRAEWSFGDEVWDSISADAKDIISKLIVEDPDRRWTAAQCLQHPWISGKSDLASGNLTAVKAKLKNFNARRKFKAAIKGVLVLNKIKNMKKLLAASPAQETETATTAATTTTTTTTTTTAGEGEEATREATRPAEGTQGV